MHTRTLFSLTIGLLILGILAACRPEAETVPGVLDVNETALARRTESVISATAPAATPIPTRPPTLTFTPPPPTRIPPSPTFPVDRSLYVRESFLPGSWKTIQMTALDGTTYTLSDFDGQAVVIQTLSTVCGVCQEQTQELKLTAERLDEIRLTENVVFINLSVDSADTTGDLESYQVTYGVDASDSITWITAKASPDLVTALGRTFGDEIADPFIGGLFFIDKNGFGHLSDSGFILEDRLQEIIIHFIGGGGVDAPTPEYNDEGTPVTPTS